jgi:aryl-alcohol dehydrogenase-like predicted oxidoreductase
VALRTQFLRFAPLDTVRWTFRPAQVVKTTASGAAEVLFNAFDQETLPAFELARARGVGLIAKVPLDSGWLSGKYGSESSFEGVRKRWSREAIERRAALIRQLAALLPQGVPMAHAALQYVLAQPGVTTVIPGAKSVEQIRDNIAAASGRLPDDVVHAIYQLWETEIKDHPLGW